MTAGLELAAAREFLFNTLTGDATLMAMLPSGVAGVRERRLPQGQGIKYPVILYQSMSAIDAAAVGVIRIWTDILFLVKVVAETGDSSVMNPLVARIDLLLHRTSGTVADGIVWTCTRERPLDDDDSVANVQFRVGGGVYRLQTA